MIPSMPIHSATCAETAIVTSMVNALETRLVPKVFSSRPLPQLLALRTRLLPGEVGVVQPLYRLIELAGLVHLRAPELGQVGERVLPLILHASGHQADRVARMRRLADGRAGDGRGDPGDRLTRR